MLYLNLITDITMLLDLNLRSYLRVFARKTCKYSQLYSAFVF